MRRFGGYGLFLVWMAACTAVVDRDVEERLGAGSKGAIGVTRLVEGEVGRAEQVRVLGDFFGALTNQDVDEKWLQDRLQPRLQLARSTRAADLWHYLDRTCLAYLGEALGFDRAWCGFSRMGATGNPDAVAGLRENLASLPREAVRKFLTGVVQVVEWFLRELSIPRPILPGDPATMSVTRYDCVQEGECEPVFLIEPASGPLGYLMTSLYEGGIDTALVVDPFLELRSGEPWNRENGLMYMGIIGLSDLASDVLSVPLHMAAHFAVERATQERAPFLAQLDIVRGRGRRLGASFWALTVQRAYERWFSSLNHGPFSVSGAEQIFRRYTVGSEREDRLQIISTLDEALEAVRLAERPEQRLPYGTWPLQVGSDWYTYTQISVGDGYDGLLLLRPPMDAFRKLEQALRSKDPEDDSKALQALHRYLCEVAGHPYIQADAVRKEHCEERLLPTTASQAPPE